MLNISGIKGHQTQIEKLSILIGKGGILHTILFSGISGIGKHKIAKAFLTSLFCKNEKKPCNKCTICKQILAGTFPDFIEVQPNEKGIIPIGSEEKKEHGTIRWLIDRLSKKSITGKYAALINGVDKISVEGQNALLKTIEEPSEGTYILLIASNRSKILPTILSRCSELKFYPLDDNLIHELLIDRGLSEYDSTLLSKISGGSAEIAYSLTNHEILDDILNICNEISTFVNGKGILDINLTNIQKLIDIDQFIDIALNIYRLNMQLIFNSNSITHSEAVKHPIDEHPYLKNIYIDDLSKVISIIKIFLALEKGRSYNLNVRNSIKGMLYSLHDKHYRHLPFLK